MKRLISMLFVCVMMFGLATNAFAADADTAAENEATSVKGVYVSDSDVPMSNDETAQTRGIETIYTGTIASGGSKTVFERDPWFGETWVIGRQSGTAGKIDVEVRNELGVVLGSKAFQSDGDGTLTVNIPWDSGKCTIRVYNHTGGAGSWTLSVSGV